MSNKQSTKAGSKLRNILRVLAWASHCEDAYRTTGTPGYRVNAFWGGLLDNFWGAARCGHTDYGKRLTIASPSARLSKNGRECI